MLKNYEDPLKLKGRVYKNYFNIWSNMSQPWALDLYNFQAFFIWLDSTVK
jgi:hypothetical protein